MQDPIKLHYVKGSVVVSARDLHEFLESKQEFANWIKNRIQKYEFVEGEDYTTFDKPVKRENNPNLSSKRKEYAITVTMAKELAMVENNQKGREARKYFIECETQLKRKKLPGTYAAALRELADTVEKAEQEKVQRIAAEKRIEELEPKAAYAQRVLRSTSTYTTTQIAKEFGMTAANFNKLLHQAEILFKHRGQWLLYAKYHNKGYTKASTTSFTHNDGQTGSRMQTEWTEKGREFLHQLMKP